MDEKLKIHVYFMGMGIPLSGLIYLCCDFFSIDFHLLGLLILKMSYDKLMST